MLRLVHRSFPISPGIRRCIAGMRARNWNQFQRQREFFVDPGNRAESIIRVIGVKGRIKRVPERFAKNRKDMESVCQAVKTIQVNAGFEQPCSDLKILRTAFECFETDRFDSLPIRLLQLGLPDTLRRVGVVLAAGGLDGVVYH